MRSAAAADTNGVAMDVPLIVSVAETLPTHAEVMSTPGAKISTIEKLGPGKRIVPPSPLKLPFPDRSPPSQVALALRVGITFSFAV